MIFGIFKNRNLLITYQHLGKLGERLCEHAVYYFCNYNYFKKKSFLKGRPSVMWSIYNFQRRAHRNLSRVISPNNCLAWGGYGTQQYRKSLLLALRNAFSQDRRCTRSFQRVLNPVQKKKQYKDKDWMSYSREGGQGPISEGASFIWNQTVKIWASMKCAREKKPSPCRVNDSRLVWSKTVKQKGHSQGGVCASAYVQMKAIGWLCMGWNKI